MGDRREAMRALMTLCSQWGHSFPQIAWDHGEIRAAVGSVAQWLSARPSWLGAVPDVPRHRRWRKLHDTGVGDLVEHATSIMSTEFGFEPVLEHTIDTPPGPRQCSMFLHPDGVLAQLTSALYRQGDWIVDDFRAWGCAEVRDWDLFDAAGPASGALACDRDTTDFVPPRLRVAISRATGSVGRGWLGVDAAVDWITPWPEPAVRTWLGPDSPCLDTDSLDRSAQLGYQNTSALLARLPDHVHALLGSIATQS
ncbi:hypothetical protein [Saccharopolyspora shandongensis]|nr:hypothetical protein [Saccharopolyspora shandongensis]